MTAICGALIKKESAKPLININAMIKPLRRHSLYKVLKSSEKRLFFGLLSIELPKKSLFENNKVVIILDGYLLDIDKSKLNNAGEHIYSLYLKYKFNTANYLNGVFNLFIYFKTENRLLIINDRFGLKPLYYYDDDRFFVFSSEVKSIINSGLVKKQINWSAWREFFAFQYLPSDKTFFKNIYKTPSGLIMNVCGKEISFIDRTRKQGNSKSLDLQHNINKLMVSLKNSARKVFPIFQKETVLSLSGGYDSRTVAFLFKKILNKQFLTLTISGAKSKIDYFLGPLVSEQLGLKNIIIKQPKKIFNNFLIIKSYLFDSMLHEHLWMIPLFFFFKKPVYYFDGAGGDVLLKGLFFPNKALNNISKFAFINAWIEETTTSNFFISKYFFSPINDRLVQKLKNYDYIKKYNSSATEFILKTRTRNSITPAIFSLFGRKTNVRFLFFEKNFVDTALSIPAEQKINDKIYLKTLKALFPEFNKIPTTNDSTLLGNVSLMVKKILIKLNLLKFIKTLLKNIFLYKNLTGKIARGDALFFNRLSLKFYYPSFFNKKLYINEINKINKRFFINMFFLNATEFLLWYNLFFKENKKVYNLIKL